MVIDIILNITHVINMIEIIVLSLARYWLKLDNIESNFFCFAEMFRKCSHFLTGIKSGNILNFFVIGKAMGFEILNIDQYKLFLENKCKNITFVIL
ncbi:hypothetical protein BpHYR1_017558 [Brachionus plicatilis]|uniref:Uncharacterized protein n=1 Tax=Brachionus plicatilis TaxID=10195 RepID=A0A3M7PND3_BRAPC|nr:hypothetical protein BpHYR1_017558 [Brachionus plicatilis]